MSENLDIDIELMDKTKLKEEIRKLRDGIRQHRDSSGHNLCWFHPELWGLLPESANGIMIKAPPTGEFLERCRQYRASLPD